MKHKQRNHFISSSIIKKALKDSIKKMAPNHMIHNPVMFIVELGFFFTFIFALFAHSFGGVGANSSLYNGMISFVLLITILFSNFSEAVAEGRGKAQADSLKKTKKELMAKILKIDGTYDVIEATKLQKGDLVLVEKGDLIPNDGEVMKGTALVDESAITGESAPVFKEAGGDFSSVTGGTCLVSDRLEVLITVSAGDSFLDRMISLVEGAKRKKTPNEIALNTILMSLTSIFLIVTFTLYPMSYFNGITISLSCLVALLVCLIPTTIGGLLSAIGIAGMDRVTQFNVIALSGKAVEACGDIDTIILDKTGTITYGNRLAAEFFPVKEVTEKEMIYYAHLSSIQDLTVEGKSIVDLAQKKGSDLKKEEYENLEFVEFQAQTRMSGLDYKDGKKLRKGASSSIKKWIEEKGGHFPEGLQEKIDEISSLGGTPLVVALEEKVFGMIYLKDTIKEGLIERFQELREFGIKSIMCTGDNPLTAATIAKEAGLDGFFAECTPEQKIEIIKAEQKLGKVVAMTGDGTNDAPALAQADVGLAMNSGTNPAKEAANMIDLDSDPTKILDIVFIGKQLLITRGVLTTFSIANDIAKYFAILPALFMGGIPMIQTLNIMKLSSTNSAILSSLIFNALIIPLLIPIAMKGVKYKPMPSHKMLLRNLLIYGVGGVITPFVGIKLIDLCVAPFLKFLGVA